MGGEKLPSARVWSNCRDDAAKFGVNILKMKYLAAALLAASPFAATSTAHSANVRLCNDCTSSQREQTAIGMVMGISGTRLVADLETGTLHAYQVSRELQPGGWYLYSAWDVGGVAQEDAAHIDTLGQIYRESGSVMSPWYGSGTLNSVSSYDAFDVVVTGPMQNDVIDGLLQLEPHGHDCLAGSHCWYAIDVLVADYWRNGLHSC